MKMGDSETILGIDRDQAKLLMSQCFLSTKVSAKILFPDRFYLPFSSLHDKIFDILDNDAIQQALVIAPRGFGKTSCVNMAYPAKKILFQEKKFIVPISCTATQAIMQGENLKRELMSNRMIAGLFGPMKSDTFSKEMWVTSNGIAVMPRGSGQQVRGILYGDHRPDLIVVDDLEDKEGVNSEEQRAKLKEWFFEDVMNSINRARKDWKIVVIGSLLHEDSLLANLLLDEDWYHAHLSICDPDTFESNWPDFMDNKAIEKLIGSYRRIGLLDSFYREYMGVPIAKESAKFRQEMFKSYKETDDDFVKNQRKKLENIVIFDPAKTTKAKSNKTAIVGIGVDTEKPAIYVRDVVVGRLHPDEQYEEAFNMADRLKAKVLGVEVTSLNEFITYPIKTLMLQEKRYYDLVELKARASKEERIAALVPFYRLGFVYHNEACCNVLEGQLMSYPRSKEDDVMDAVAYVVEMLELGERYFVPADEVDVEGKPKDIEDEYKEYMGDDYEVDKPLGNWRQA
jgi:phage terminase large subunit-like protein